MSNYYVVCTTIDKLYGGIHITSNPLGTLCAKSLKEAKQIAARSLCKAKGNPNMLKWECEISVVIGCEEEGKSLRAVYKKRVLINDN